MEMLSSTALSFQKYQSAFPPHYNWIIVYSICIFFLGVGDLVTSVLLCEDTSQKDFGLIFIGVIAVVTSILGCSIGYTPNRYVLRFVVLTVLFSFVAFFQAVADYIEKADLVACSSYDGEYSDSCGTNTLLSCFGNNHYYAEAISCQSTAVDDRCYCVRAGSSSCIHIEGPNCAKLTNSVQVEAKALLIVTLLIALVCPILSIVYTCRPSCCSNDEKDEDCIAYGDESSTLPPYPDAYTLAAICNDGEDTSSTDTTEIPRPFRISMGIEVNDIEEEEESTTGKYYCIAADIQPTFPEQDQV